MIATRSEALPLSVLMPVFNTASYVAEAVRSILDQSFRDFELVIIDDGSTDGSLAVLQSLAAADPRIVLSSRENRGLIATRNELLSLACGALIAWMDSDDIAPLDRLALQIREFEANAELVCLGGAVLHVDSDGWPLTLVRFPTTDSELREKITDSPFSFGATMARRDTVLKVGGFRDVFEMGEDYDLILRLIEVGQVGNVEQTLQHYRLWPQSTSHRLGHRWAQYRELAHQLAEERRVNGQDRLQRGETVELDFSRHSVTEANVRLHQTHTRWARESLSHGYRRTAFKHALLAIKAAPTSIETWSALARVVLNAKPF